MNNIETVVTSDTQDTGQNKHQCKQKEQSSDTQDTGQINTRVNRRVNE